MNQTCGFLPAPLLLPAPGVDLTRWAMIACDQYTADRGYWQQMDALVGAAPSTLRMVVPEVYLADDDAAARQAAAADTMRQYLAAGVLQQTAPAFVYVRRSAPGLALREGLVGMVDLEQFDYRPASRTPIRPTEETVAARLPARIAVRSRAALECPHILMLCDDPLHTVIHPLGAVRSTLKQCYDFDLAGRGGHITGYLVDDPRHIALVQQALQALPAPDGMRFAVGDGNHSLCAALECWRALRPTLDEAQRQSHPARYALCELVNLHDAGLTFHPIHRVIYGCSGKALLDALCAALGTAPAAQGNVQLVCGDFTAALALPEPALTALQPALDALLAQNGWGIDYVHAEETCRKESAGGQNTAVLLQSMDKYALFPAIAAGGVLPRKTFSLGQEDEKRYYLECRGIL